MWRKVLTLTWPDRFFYAEAALWLLWARLLISVLPFRLVVAGLRNSNGGKTNTAPNDIGGKVSVAIERLSRNLPITLVCLPQALAAMWMLRARGLCPRMLYGVSTSPEDGFKAHAWVLLDGTPVVGHRAAVGFTVLTQFPASDPAELTEGNT